MGRHVDYESFEEPVEGLRGVGVAVRFGGNGEVI